MANTLLLRLEGPLQAWGERSHWTIRDTAAEPTKSGIVGLLGCAQGMTADDDLQGLSRSIRIGVRCDRPGTIFTDFHTVKDGVLLADGKLKKDPVISKRDYLSDASFLVAVQASPEVINRLSQAVRQPVWPYYLGRKSCVPSKPVYEGEGDYPDLPTVLSAWPVQNPDWMKRSSSSLRAVVEVTPDQGVPRKDEISSRSRRTFLLRYTHEISVTPPIQTEVE
jgi:CRISPR system Cascade subunit CasD